MNALNLPSINIALTDLDLITPPDDESDMNIALTLARSLPSTHLEREGIPLMVEIGSAAEYHKMLGDLGDGELTIKEFAFQLYMAGRLSLAVGKQTLL